MLASSRATPRRREPGGYGIRPYNGFSAGRASGLPMWPVVAGRHVGEGHAPPANPAPETRGFPGICGTYKTTVGRDALIPPHPAPPQTPAGGINPSPTNHGGRAANRETANPAPETRGFPGICGTYKMTVGRDALIPPHPAAPRTPAGGPWPSLTNHGRPAANRETTNFRIPHPPVGDDARIVPGTPRRRERPREG